MFVLENKVNIVKNLEEKPNFKTLKNRKQRYESHF